MSNFLSFFEKYKRRIKVDLFNHFVLIFYFKLI